MAIGTPQDAAMAGQIGRAGKYNILFNVLFHFSGKTLSCKFFKPY